MAAASTIKNGSFYEFEEEEDEFDIMILTLLTMRRKEKRTIWIGNLCKNREEYGAFHHIHNDLTDSEFR